MSIKRRLMLASLFIPLAAAVIAVLTTLLPDNAYVRYQLMEGTIYAPVRHHYERMNFDPEPIDVAILGSSRTRRGLSPDWIEQVMAERGSPGTVYNFSLVGDGRNVQWVLFQELLRTKKPKVVVISISEHDFPWGHDSFRFVAPSSEVWRETAHGLHDMRKNLPYLPFRQLKLFGASLAPDAFGFRSRFDPKLYAQEIEASRYQLTVGYRASDGRWMDVNKPVPRDALLAEMGKNAGDYHLKSRLPAAIRDFHDADNRFYTDLIVSEARKHGVKVMFVYLPGFGRGQRIIQGRAYYEQYGPIVDNTDVSDRDELYYDWSHLNPKGMDIVSRRLGVALADVLAGRTPASPGGVAPAAQQDTP